MDSSATILYPPPSASTAADTNATILIHRDDELNNSDGVGNGAAASPTSPAVQPTHTVERKRKLPSWMTQRKPASGSASKRCQHEHDGEGDGDDAAGDVDAEPPTNGTTKKKPSTRSTGTVKPRTNRAAAKTKRRTAKSSRQQLSDDADGDGDSTLVYEQPAEDLSTSRRSLEGELFENTPFNQVEQQTRVQQSAAGYDLSDDDDDMSGLQDVFAVIVGSDNDHIINKRKTATYVTHRTDVALPDIATSTVAKRSKPKPATTTSTTLRSESDKSAINDNDDDADDVPEELAALFRVGRDADEDAHGGDGVSSVASSAPSGTNHLNQHHNIGLSRDKPISQAEVEETLRMERAYKRREARHRAQVAVERVRLGSGNSECQVESTSSISPAAVRNMLFAQLGHVKDDDAIAEPQESHTADVGWDCKGHRRSSVSSPFTNNKARNAASSPAPSSPPAFTSSKSPAVTSTHFSPIKPQTEIRSKRRRKALPVENDEESVGDDDDGG